MSHSKCDPKLNFDTGKAEPPWLTTARNSENPTSRNQEDFVELIPVTSRAGSRFLRLGSKIATSEWEVGTQSTDLESKYLDTAKYKKIIITMIKFLIILGEIS